MVCQLENTFCPEEVRTKNIFAYYTFNNRCNGQFNDIKIIICSVLPVYDYTWKTGLNPVEKINALNEIIRNYALNNEIMYLDYYSLMVDDKKGLIKDYTYDGVHPNKKGYKIMSTLAEAAIATTLSKEN